MDFHQIALTRKELRLLKRARKRCVPIAGAERLLRLRFVAEIHEPVPGYRGNPTGMVEITPLGLDFLSYRALSLRREFFTPIAVSVLTTIALHLLKGLLPLIQRLF